MNLLLNLVADTVADSATSGGVKTFQSSPMQVTIIYWQNQKDFTRSFLMQYSRVQHSPLYYILLIQSTNQQSWKSAPPFLRLASHILTPNMFFYFLEASTGVLLWRSIGHHMYSCTCLIQFLKSVIVKNSCVVISLNFVHFHGLVWNPEKFTFHFVHSLVCLITFLTDLSKIYIQQLRAKCPAGSIVFIFFSKRQLSKPLC